MKNSPTIQIEDPKNEDRETHFDREKLNQVITGYRTATVLFAANRLGIFAAADGGRTADEISEKLGTSRRTTQILLDTLLRLKLLTHETDRYDNTPFGKRFLLEAGEQCLVHNLAYQACTWRNSWSRLEEVVRAGKPVCGYDRLHERQPGFATTYLRAMEEISRRSAREIAAHLHLPAYGRMLDIGAGSGVYTRELLQRYPFFKGDLLDGEDTLAVAEREFFHPKALRDRVRFIPGDYRSLDFGAAQYDLVLASHVTHNEPESENRRMLRKIFEALKPGGSAVIHDFVRGSKTDATLIALFDIHLAVLTDGGKVYPGHAYSTWLRQAGFREIRWRKICSETDNPTVAIIATKLGTDL